MPKYRIHEIERVVVGRYYVVTADNEEDAKGLWLEGQLGEPEDEQEDITENYIDRIERIPEEWRPDPEQPQILPLRAKFFTIHDQHMRHLGERFELLGVQDPTMYDYDEVGPIYLIRLQGGEEIGAWPDEIFDYTVPDQKGEGDA